VALSIAEAKYIVVGLKAYGSSNS